MAAVGATGFAAVPAQAVDSSARGGTLLLAQEHDQDESVAAPATDPGLALTERIQTQAVQQRATAEDAARRQAAQLAAAKQARAQQIAAEDQARAAADQAARTRAAQEQLRAQQAQAEAQAQSERAHAEAAAAQAVGPRLGTLVAPVAGSVPGAGFGQSDSFWAHLHTGQDFAAPTGTPVVAIGDGSITSAGWAGAYGYRVVQTLADGTELWYCHLSAIGTGAGAVTAGQPIGRVGATGSNVTAPHLHLEVRPTGGEPVDPSTWLAGHGLAL
ncbi:M23 family metallopeptidase [Streptacidiphilus sp. N1-3]|uniref:M23 family metallopeptidase n=1 Tax=Streptacidiphilus alkalitolerans TaxID=3342712 RepID=A0ABV6X7Y1_9ACTN